MEPALRAAIREVGVEAGLAFVAAGLRDAVESGATTGPVLFTRASGPHVVAVLRALPDAMHDPTGRILAWPPRERPNRPVAS